jgi:hypothetical protein
MVHSRQCVVFPLSIDDANFEVTVEGCSRDRLPFGHEDNPSNFGKAGLVLPPLCAITAQAVITVVRR